MVFGVCFVVCLTEPIKCNMHWGILLYNTKLDSTLIYTLAQNKEQITYIYLHLHSHRYKDRKYTRCVKFVVVTIWQINLSSQEMGYLCGLLPMFVEFIITYRNVVVYNVCYVCMCRSRGTISYLVPITKVTTFRKTTFS